MGGLFASEKALEDRETYCETCCDYDWLIGYADTREKAWNLLKDYTTPILVCINAESSNELLHSS